VHIIFAVLSNTIDSSSGGGDTTTIVDVGGGDRIGAEGGRRLRTTAGVIVVVQMRAGAAPRGWKCRALSKATGLRSGLLPTRSQWEGMESVQEEEKERERRRRFWVRGKAGGGVLHARRASLPLPQLQRDT
jgi:hypothetical protein